ncbi:DNA-binding protein [Glaciecola sp. SC05]|uniref:DNA-binding protein n=1 Tax=Glaciecola sp. SC05 TaxID=1987355 RepID=UPI003528D790
MDDTQGKKIQSKVNAICDDLYSKGVKPTTRTVLKMVNELNSTSSILKYIQNWKELVAEKEQRLFDELGFSSEFTQSFMKEVSRFRLQIEQHAKEQESEARNMKDIAISELDKLEKRLQEKLLHIEKQDKELEQLRAEQEIQAKSYEVKLEKEAIATETKVNELREQLGRACEENTRVTNENRTLHTELAKAELKVEGNQDYILEIKAKNCEYADINKELQRERVELSIKVARLEEKVDGNEKLIASLQ